MTELHPYLLVKNLNDVMIKLKFCKSYDIDLFAYAKKYSPYKKIIVIGSNPSFESPDNTAFHPSTKSGKIVRSWFEDEKIYVVFTNIHNIKGEIKDLPKLSIDETERDKNSYINNCIFYNYKIVACGKYVQDIMKEFGVTHFKVPHPSGCCRFWNDKEAGKAKIEEMIRWINGN